MGFECKLQMQAKLWLKFDRFPPTEKYNDHETTLDLDSTKPIDLFTGTSVRFSPNIHYA
jgi:hypothetical protein